MAIDQSRLHISQCNLIFMTMWQYVYKFCIKLTHTRDQKTPLNHVGPRIR